MRKPVKEIENVLQNHGYSINNIICEVMKTFKLKTLCRQVGFQKEAGYSTSEILTLMLMLPLMLLKSCLLYTSDAADEEDSVDLGGRRIIKKKKKKKNKKSE